MRGENRPHIERLQGARHHLGPPAGLAHAAQRPAHRSALRRGEIFLSRAPHPMGLLRGVDQDEEHCEGTGGQPRRLGRERAGPREQRVEIRRARDAEPAGPAGPPQLFDRPERFFPRQPADHPSERRRQPPHVLAQWSVLRSRHGRREGNGGGDVSGRHR